MSHFGSAGIAVLVVGVGVLVLAAFLNEINTHPLPKNPNATEHEREVSEGYGQWLETKMIPTMHRLGFIAAAVGVVLVLVSVMT